MSVHDSPHRVGIADQTLTREQGIKPSVFFGCRLIAASTSGRLLATHSLTAADHTAFSAACRGPGTRSSTTNPLISLPTVILSGCVTPLSSKVFVYTSTSKVFRPSSVQDLRPVSALPAPGALESARRPLQLLIEAALPAVQLSRRHRVCPAGFFQGHTGLPFLQHRQVLLVAPSAPPTTDLPGLIWSSLNDRLDRNQGGHGHVQETVHARRDPATSADG